MFSHVAGGTAPAGMAKRPQADVMPKGVGWILDRVEDVQPELNSVTLASGRRVTYDHLVVCPGIQKDWDRVPRLAAAMAPPHGASNYEFDLAAKASRLLRDLRSGAVVFTQPAGPATCAGAAQKPIYLACDYWRAMGRLKDIRVVLVVPDPTVFGMPLIDDELSRKISEYGIELKTSTELIEVDAENRTVVVGRTDGSARAGSAARSRSRSARSSSSRVGSSGELGEGRVGDFGCQALCELDVAGGDRLGKLSVESQAERGGLEDEGLICVISCSQRRGDYLRELCDQRIAAALE